MTAYRRSPRRLLAALDQVRDELAPETLLADVQRAWRDAVGAAIAGQARPTGERGGVVTVSCSSSVWAQELDLMAPAIIERLNRHLTGASGGVVGRRVLRLRCVTLPAAM
jgi:predicted nucleic acid-binding Zn ribbon protein